jgi:hypothetical protein
MASPLYTNADLNQPTEWGQAAPAPVNAEHGQFLQSWDPTSAPNGNVPGNVPATADPKDAIMAAAKGTLAETAPLADQNRKIDADTAAANAQGAANAEARGDVGNVVKNELSFLGGTAATLAAPEAAGLLPEGVGAVAKSALTNVLGRGAAAYEGYHVAGLPGAVAGGLAPEILSSMLPKGLTSKLGSVLEGLKGAAVEAPEAEAAATTAAEAAGRRASRSEFVRAFGGLGPGEAQVPAITPDDANLVREYVAKGMDPQTALRTVAGESPEAQRVLSGLMNAVGDNHLANTVGSQAFDAEQEAFDAAQEAAGGIANPAFHRLAGSPIGPMPNIADMPQSPDAWSALEELRRKPDMGGPSAVQGPEADPNVNPNLLSPLDRLSRLSRARALGQAFRKGTPFPPEQ